MVSVGRDGGDTASKQETSNRDDGEWRCRCGDVCWTWLVYVTKQIGTILYSTYLLSLSSKQTFRGRGERSEGRASLG